MQAQPRLIDSALDPVAEGFRISVQEDWIVLGATRRGVPTRHDGAEQAVARPLSDKKLADIAPVTLEITRRPLSDDSHLGDLAARKATERRALDQRLEPKLCRIAAKRSAVATDVRIPNTRALAFVAPLRRNGLHLGDGIRRGDDQQWPAIDADIARVAEYAMSDLTTATHSSWLNRRSPRSS